MIPEDVTDELREAFGHLRQAGLICIAVSDASESTYWILAEEAGVPRLRLSNHSNPNVEVAVDVRPDDDLEEAVKSLQAAHAEWQLQQSAEVSVGIEAAVATIVVRLPNRTITVQVSFGDDADAVADEAAQEIENELGSDALRYEVMGAVLTALEH